MNDSSKKDKVILDEIKELVIKINYHDHLYYNENKQDITDIEYDVLRKDLENLETQYPHLILPESPTKKVGSAVNNEFKTYAHNTPMLSLNNGYNEDEVKAFFLKFSKIFKDFKILAETKVDGLSASLIYENHKLVRALTRGDGLQGEDITSNIVHVDNVKKKLPIDFPAKLEIRGEVFMPKIAFIKLNEERKVNNQQTFSTARNAASGSIRQLDPEITKQRKLRFFGYTIISKEKYFGDTLLKTRNILSNNNFALNTPSALCSSVNEMLAFYNNINDIRDKLEYEIDGIVYKLNSYEQQKKMGFTSRFPKWALAHKFPAEEVSTKIVDVKFQVGRTGSITPVAVLEEVLVGGVKISRATLHNQDEIKRLNINIGDIVKLQRAGDVIPKIISVKEKANNKDKIKITFPSTCPSCNQKLIKTEKEVALRCINFDYCEEQIVHRISHFVSRQALNIEGLGEKQIRFLIEKGIIKNTDDIFLLKRKHDLNIINLYQYDGWGKKSVENLFKAIKKSSTVPFDKFIYSLGIRHVGKELAITLSNNFKSLEELIYAFSNLDKESLPECDGLGDVIINSLQSYFLNQKCLTLVTNLKNHLSIEYTNNLSQGIYKDKKIVITGSFENFKRSEIEFKLRSLGGKVLSSISKNTDFLIAGKDAGSKMQKAETMNIDIKGIDFVNDLMNN
ncbi:MAG: NAD-dependent DNA ligase LigA [Pseudomonadota bacterium]|nr:NAD-dependent DNA ligase LigA [Pseudomonadota bacterium]